MTIEVYAVADVVPDSCDYITAGKEYEVISDQNYYSFMIVNDDGQISSCLWRGCRHLKGGNWRRIKRDSVPSTDTTFWQAAYLAAIRAGNPEPWAVANIAAKKLEERK